MFKNEADFERIVSRLNIDSKPNPAHRESLRRQMLSAFNETGEKRESQTNIFQTLRGTIMKRPVPKLAAAAAAVILIAVVIGIYHGGGGIERIALGEVIENTKKMPWMKVAVMVNDGGEKEVYHQWYDFRSKRMFTKRVAYVRLSDLAEEKDYYYRFSDNTLSIKKLREKFFWADSPIGFWGKLVEELESDGWHLTQRRDKFGSADVEVFELSRPLPWNSPVPIVNGTEVSKERWELVVDRKSKLVIASSSEWIDKKDEVLRQSEWLISYPESGPKDIYALGVPQTAKIRDLTDTSTAKTIDKSNQYSKDTAAPKLVPIDIKLPRAMFEGTPQPVQVSHWEKPLGKPRSPFLAPVGTKNVAFGKPVTSTDELPIIGELEWITDGDKEAADGSFVELGPFKQSVTIDLEAEYNIYAILFWHYHKQACVFFDVVVQVADDPDFITNVTTLFNNDIDNSAGLGLGKDMHYTETHEGKLIDARGARARYVRLYSNGSTANDLNRYIEVEVFGKSAK